MLGVSGMLGSSGDGPAPGDGSAGLSSGEDERMKFEDSERNSGGNRWPRQETIALIKIRSDMDSAFRDSSLKGPLWDEVSRKLAELGYHRSAKKCKEKFENVYKYHKRTKDGRTTKSEGKTYRFFDQLEALDQNQPPSQFPSLPPPPPPPRPQNQGPESPTPVAMAMPTNIHHPIFPQVTITSTPVLVPTNVSHNLNTPITLPVPNQTLSHPVTLPLSNPSPPPAQPPASAANTTAPTNNANATPNSCLNQNLNTNLESDLGSSSPSSSEGEEDPERRRKRKRKWEDFFQKLMSEVIQKQEKMQKDFLETLERRERDRVSREEAWRAQEAARINREHELLAQERSMAAAKDSAVIAYLQKISDQSQQIPSQIPTQTPTKTQMPVLQDKDIHTPNPNSEIVTLPPPPQPRPQPQPQPQPQPSPQQMQIQPYDNARNGSHATGASSSRWPKAEIQALIQLRTNMDIKYQDNGPKGPLWEEISAEMRKIGYDRNARRCKEKWENINKYYKKVKESNKKRPEDSKTCPYFHLLDQIYREKSKSNPTAPMMVQPEQQWPQPLDRESDEMDGEDEEEEERE